MGHLDGEDAEQVAGANPGWPQQFRFRGRGVLLPGGSALALGIVRMARTLKVYLTAPSPDLVHQWRNFGEDVWSKLRAECEVSIDEIDASTSEFFVRGIHKRELRTIATRVRKIAEKNLMSQIVSVTEIADDHDA